MGKKQLQYVKKQNPKFEHENRKERGRGKEKHWEPIVICTPFAVRKTSREQKVKMKRQKYLYNSINSEVLIVSQNLALHSSYLQTQEINTNF